MILDRKYYKKAGVYCITNVINNKKYIGQSVNLYRRITSIKYALNVNNPKLCNHLLRNDWNIYGSNNFKVEVIELTNDLLIREKHWIEYYNTTDINKGYNLRKDGLKGMITHPSTSNKMSENMKKRLKDSSYIEHLSKKSKETWKDKDKLENMKNKLKVINSKYKFYKYSLNNELLSEYDNIDEVIKDNPSLRKSNIYQVTYGIKKSHGGYKWKKEFKI